MKVQCHEISMPLLYTLSARSQRLHYHGFIFTFALKDIESGSLKHWQTKAAPDVAIRYWKLPVSLKRFEQLNWNSEKNLYDILFFV